MHSKPADITLQDYIRQITQNLAFKSNEATCAVNTCTTEIPYKQNHVLDSTRENLEWRKRALAEIESLKQKLSIAELEIESKNQLLKRRKTKTEPESDCDPSMTRTCPEATQVLKTCIDDDNWATFSDIEFPFIYHDVSHATSFLQYIQSFNIHYSSFRQTASAASIDAMQRAIEKIISFMEVKIESMVVQETRKMETKLKRAQGQIEKTGEKRAEAGKEGSYSTSPTKGDEEKENQFEIIFETCLKRFGDTIRKLCVIVPVTHFPYQSLHSTLPRLISLLYPLSFLNHHCCFNLLQNLQRDPRECLVRMIVDIGTFDGSIGKSIVETVIHEMTIICEGRGQEKIEDREEESKGDYHGATSENEEEMMWIVDNTCFYLLWILEESSPTWWTATSVQQLLSLLSQSVMINITSAESHTLLNATFEKYLWSLCEKVWIDVDEFATADYIVDSRIGQD
ncbi:6946_t:CDS:2 [Paraglomus occultum]|uniref:6946_t:CDS:1 n=1 Tax=Paraglomus occultum TaxID=144539 RepID=A0A9N8Z436_9GLOM|nr:6946_t:CDS:2 [Paraglomus occultum]